MAQVAFYIWYVLLNVSKWTYEDKERSRELNGYLVLMNKILEKDEPFGLINFNYDLLLDYAYKDSHKVTLFKIDDYLSNNYVKPHGSVNWLLSKRASDPRIDLLHEHNMDTRTRLDLAVMHMYKDSPLRLDSILVKEPDHRDLYTMDDLLKCFKKQYFYPLIFLPLTSKAYSSISGFEEKIMAKGRELIGRSDEIYLVGYRANDDIIKTLLQSAPYGTKLHVVGNSSATTIMDTVLAWAKNLQRGNLYSDGFHRFVHDVTL